MAAKVIEKTFEAFVPKRTRPSQSINGLHPLTNANNAEAFKA